VPGGISHDRLIGFSQRGVMDYTTRSSRSTVLCPDCHRYRTNDDSPCPYCAMANSVQLPRFYVPKISLPPGSLRRAIENLWPFAVWGILLLGVCFVIVNGMTQHDENAKAARDDEQRAKAYEMRRLGMQGSDETLSNSSDKVKQFEEVERQRRAGHVR
jgi:hypothetical protein